MMEEFREIVKNRYQIMQDLHDKGEKIIGWGCTYIVEEIVSAAGMLPIRVIGGKGETPLGDARLYSNICSFVRSCLDEALRDKYQFLQGFVTCNSCDPIRRLYDTWSYYIKTPYASIFSLPDQLTQETVEFFKKELIRFREELEAISGRQITPESLIQAIDLYNQTRVLLHNLYGLRKGINPPISGAEVLDVVLAGMIIPRERYNRLLQGLLAELSKRKLDTNAKVRLLLMGSELDDSQYVQLIEDSGGLVVMDDLCNGSRYFSGLVKKDGDPLDALARRYLERPPCPKMMYPSHSRVKYLQGLARDYAVEGVIYQTIKFCDNHSGIFTIIKHGFDEIGIPVLNLQREYVLSGTGQMKTRVQAFIESIAERTVR